MDVFPDVLEAVRAEALRPLGVPCVVKVPNPRPPKLVRLSNAGGELLDGGLSLRQLIIFEVWGPDEKTARDLAVSALHFVDSWVSSSGTVEDIEVTWPVSFPDPETSTPRYTFNIQFYVLPEPHQPTLNEE